MLRLRVVFVLVASALVASCGGGNGGGASGAGIPAGPTPIPIQPSYAHRYMIGQTSAIAIALDAQASAVLNGTHPYIIETYESGPYAQSAPAAWEPIYVVRWTSEVQLANDLPLVPSWVTVLMYDNEPGADTAPSTPPNESANPGPFYAAAAALTHSTGRLFLPTAGVADPLTRQAVYNSALSWDGYEAQTQTSLNNIPLFDANIQSYLDNVRAINPNIGVFGAGTGDFAGGTLMPLAQIEAAVKTIPAAMFTWLNFGRHAGPHCTDPSVCPIPERLDLEIQLIKDLH